MRLDDIFIPKKSGYGWTLNTANPISWMIIIVLVVVAAAFLYPRIKALYYYYFKKD